MARFFASSTMSGDRSIPHQPRRPGVEHHARQARAAAQIGNCHTALFADGRLDQFEQPLGTFIVPGPRACWFFIESGEPLRRAALRMHSSGTRSGGASSRSTPTICLISASPEFRISTIFLVSTGALPRAGRQCAATSPNSSQASLSPGAQFNGALTAQKTPCAPCHPRAGAGRARPNSLAGTTRALVSRRNFIAPRDKADVDCIDRSSGRPRSSLPSGRNGAANSRISSTALRVPSDNSAIKAATGLSVCN